MKSTSGGKGLSELGFGAEARDALRQHADFLRTKGSPAADGQRVAGVYRRSIMLASGRFASCEARMYRESLGDVGMPEYLAKLRCTLEDQPFKRRRPPW